MSRTDVLSDFVAQTDLAGSALSRAGGARLRKLDIGLRGIIVGLHYSFLGDPAGHGERIKEGIGWDGAICTKPEKEDEMPGLIQKANPLTAVSRR